MPTRVRRAEEMGVPVEDLDLLSFNGPPPPEGTIRFRVFGDPKPQGSMRTFIPKGGTRPVITAQGGSHLKMWRQDVAAAAARVLGRGEPINEPVAIDLKFFIRRPISVAKKRRYPAVKPDIDKLARAILDALVHGGLLTDDKLVVRLTLSKDYTEKQSGVVVRLRTMERGGLPRDFREDKT